jgi:hypothetical protein
MIPEMPPAAKTTAKATPTGEEETRPALRPPQFKLATLFWIVSGCGVLFAAMSAVGPLGAFALLVLVLAIIAHVSGAAIGAQLREIGSTKDPQEALALRSPQQGVAEHEFAPKTQLCRRTSISRTMIGCTIAGAVLLGAVGSAILFWLAWGHVNLPTAIVAIGSSCLLGGLVGFMGSSFAQIAGGAMRQAGRGVK